MKKIADGLEISQSKEFWSDLSKSKLFVTTNNSTTFIQAMHANCPSVLILLGRQKAIRPISREVFKELEDVGIVCTDISASIEHINHISENPQNGGILSLHKRQERDFASYIPAAAKIRYQR